jgi:Anti-sigma factor N-terminus
MKKGIILEIKRDILVMMTPEGEFLTGKKQPYQQYAIGEEIPFFPLRTESAKPKPFYKWNWKVSTSLLTALVVIIALFSSTMLQNNRAYAYVSVDINPSMELTLNNQQQVIKIKPYNDDAVVLLKKLKNWENDDVSEVTERIFLLSERLGYLKENQNVLITSSIIGESDPQRENELMDEINEFVQEYSSEHNTSIVVKETSEKIREEAAEKGMTAGSLIRETDKKKTQKAIEHENKNAVIKEEKTHKETNNNEENSKPQNKANPSLKGKKQKAKDSENQTNNNARSHPQETKQKEKPVQSQNGNSSHYNNGNRNKDKSNRGHNERSNNEQEHSKYDGNQNDHQNRKEEKKNDQDERNENKKD